jgi:uncharacterized membrane protein YccC
VEHLRVRTAVTHSIALGIACLISYGLITQLLVHAYSLSAADDLHGGMWATVSTVFVYRSTYQQSAAAAVSRIAATSLSFVLCLAYLLILPFHPWGLALLITIGALAMMLIGRPDDVVTTGITTTVVMIFAATSPHAA